MSSEATEWERPRPAEPDRALRIRREPALAIRRRSLASALVRHLLPADPHHPKCSGQVAGKSAPGPIRFFYWINAKDDPGHVVVASAVEGSVDETKIGGVVVTVIGRDTI